MSESVTVLTFAGARDVVGAASVEVGLPTSPCSVAVVMDALCRDHPDLEPHRPSLKLAVNGVYADADTLVRSGDEVALIPPVAGG
ncbi:MAG: MoaD/ThiS family protein [Myxococcota bacterium]